MLKKGFAPLRSGFNEHHPYMTTSEIAVFCHLLPLAIRTHAKSEELGYPIGFCPGATGNRVAQSMGKSRDATHRALKGLSWNEKTKRRYITCYPEGIFIHNFDGEGVADHFDEGEEMSGNLTGGGRNPAAGRNTAGRDPGRRWPESRPEVAGIQAGGGRNPAGIKEANEEGGRRNGAGGRNTAGRNPASPTGCSRNHDVERVRGRGWWTCPDDCGWMERLPPEDVLR